MSTGVAATGVTTRGDRVVAVDTTAGPIQPGAVVFATGLPPTLDGLDVDVPWERVKGHLLVTEPTPVHLPGIVAPVATQLEDGRLLVGGTFDTGDESPVVRPEIIDSILAGLYATLPELRGLRADYQWCCFRPRHPDGLPVIDRIHGLRNAWLTSGHYRTGILQRAGHRADAGPLDQLGRAAGRGADVEQRPVRRPRPARLAPVSPRRSAPAGRPAAGGWRRCRSRYSSSGMATRRVVPSTWRACAAVNGCGSWARMRAASWSAPGASTTCSASRSSSPARAAAATALVSRPSSRSRAASGAANGCRARSPRSAATAACTRSGSAGAARRARPQRPAAHHQGRPGQRLDQLPGGQAEPGPGRLHRQAGRQRLRRPGAR